MGSRLRLGGEQRPRHHLALWPRAERSWESKSKFKKSSQRGILSAPSSPWGTDRRKRTLGFLPDQGFLDRARKGTLLAAIVADQLLGYVLYDLPGHDVKIVHLCVSPHARQKGIARRLIEEVAERHTGRHRIVLSCRYDYEATAVWEALGFRPQGSRPGRSQAGHMLTVWVRDFEPLTLFDDFHDERAVAALDHNVFLDLHMDATQRPQGEESRYLLADWIGEYVELCLTDEVFYEIHKHADADERAVEQHGPTCIAKCRSPMTGGPASSTKSPPWLRRPGRRTIDMWHALPPRGRRTSSRGTETFWMLPARSRKHLGWSSFRPRASSFDLIA